MGVKSFFHELKSKVSASRFFKAMIIESPEHAPKCNKSVKSIDVVEGHGITSGSVIQTNYHEGLPFKYTKHRLEEVDTENYLCKYTLIEGGILGDRLEKICYELKVEETGDGGCVIKSKTELHPKTGVELSDDEINVVKDMASNVFKACEEYLSANPHVCV